MPSGNKSTPSPGPPPSRDFSKVYEKIFTPPDDSISRRAYISNDFTRVPILIDNMVTDIEFLTSLASAITILFYPSRCLNVSNLADGELLSTISSREVLMIISTKSLSNNHQLTSQSRKQNALFGHPYILLQDIEYYQKYPKAKHELWKNISRVIGSQKSP